jgi:hypothetical protein
MKSLRLGLIIAVGFGILISTAVRAEGPDRDFWSVNVGTAYAWEDDAFSNLESDEFAGYLSGTWGWGPAFLPDWIGVEAELGTTVSDGTWLGEDWSMISGAGYLTTSLGSDSLYLKLRGGVSSNRADVGGFTATETGLAGSIGLGFKAFGQPLELHLTAIDSDVNAITLHWQF